MGARAYPVLTLNVDIDFLRPVGPGERYSLDTGAGRLRSRAVPTDRPAARVVCVDQLDRVLLLNWLDPVDGRRIWEPPGGGLEPGESPAEAAARELWEETGARPTSELSRSTPVPRRFRWAGEDYDVVETFFLARLGHFEVAAGALTDGERTTYLGHRWLAVEELDSLDGLEPPNLREIVEALL